MKVLNCTRFKEMLVSGANNLANKHEEINTLNVFPVPDGDTGTNMNMTFGSGVAEVSKVMSDHVGDTCKLLSKSMLMSARGNSGVILSQIFKGVYKSVADKQSVTAADLAEAFVNGSRIAYRAVMRPVEGTILTVCREASEYGQHMVEENPDTTIEQYFDKLLQEARESLSRTPDLLPVLKEVGVVDSGGAGLVAVLEGFVAYLKGRPIGVKSETVPAEEKELGYCVETVVKLNKGYDEERISKAVSKAGNIVNLCGAGNEAKVHVHSLKPGDIISALQTFGELMSVKIENLAVGHNVTLDYEDNQPKEKYAIITVCNGDGIQDMFHELGVTYFINGGQTMNPSTESFVSLIEKINADNIIILPNNGNIILAAEQSREVLSDRNITVLPTKTIPEGIAACVVFNPEGELADNIEEMKAAVANVTTGSVTHAIKDTSFNGIQIKEGDFMAIRGKDIVASLPDMMETSRALLDALVNDDTSVVTIIYGSEATQKQAEELQKYIVSEYDVDCDITDGKQDLYPFIVGVE